MAAPLRDAFQHELAELGLLLLDGGEVAAAALVLARRAVGVYDTALVEAVGERERAAADVHATIVRRIESVLALQAPVAGDLRIVLGILEASQHVQRAARNGLRAVRVVGPRVGLVEEEPVLACVEEMADRAADMLGRALRAFSTRDVAAARAVVDEDLVVDHLHGEAANRILDLGDRPVLRDWTIGMLFASRWFERAADHAVAIAERVPYVVTGSPSSAN